MTDDIKARLREAMEWLEHAWLLRNSQPEVRRQEALATLRDALATIEALEGENARLKAALESPVVRNPLETAAMYDAPEHTMEAFVFGKPSREALLFIRHALTPEVTK